MVGRIDLFSIQDDEIRTAELGYRIGKQDNEKGYATEAVKLALEEGCNCYKLGKIEAGTSPDNIASQRVLEKNGFVMTKRMEKAIEVNGKLLDSLIFEKYI